MKTLFVDTTQPTQTLALWDGKTLSEQQDNEAKASSRLHEGIQSMLAETGWKLAEVERVVLTIGPGSFTGIRVGLALAQALKLHPQADIRTLTTFEAVSLSANCTGAHTVVLDSLAKEVFVQRFSSKGQAKGEPTCCLPEDAKLTGEVFGNGAVKLGTLLPDMPLDVDELCSQADGFSTEMQPLYLKGLNFRKVSA